MHDDHVLLDPGQVRRVRAARRRVRLVRLAALALACHLLASPLALLAIDGYQACISPRKGWHCAHRALHGGHSCSQYGEQVIRRHGLIAGLPMLDRRFGECHAAAEALRAGNCTPDRKAEGCFETEEERGRREGKETRDYCCGFAEGCCSGDSDDD